MSIDAVLLDRDGVINHDSTNYIKSPDEWKPVSGSLDAIALMHQSGKKIGVATNQRGLALGLYSEQTLTAIHQKMHAAIARVGGKIDALAFCPHDTSDRCNCRKPRPGMLLQLMRQLNAEPEHTIMVGDKLSDIEAAQAARITPVLVLSGKGQDTVYNHQRKLGATQIFADLAAVTLALRAGTLKRATE